MPRLEERHKEQVRRVVGGNPEHPICQLVNKASLGGCPEINMAAEFGLLMGFVYR